ncbi:MULTISPECIES: hypothetical protein [unclassified Curtobacterium]|uniref:hypothetical protein n=1 Tax=unclassified Curtobacterium TaxID=257496 RepID=UPI0015E89EC5|nr:MULTISPECIES: hypothetical protein [unclassified Curtobacterium]
MRYLFNMAAAVATVLATMLGGPTHADPAPRAVDLDLGTAVLQRGETGAIDIGFEQLGGHPGTVEGDVTVSAPAGTTFPTADNDALGQYRNPGWARWLSTSRLRLTDARVSGDRTQATYSLRGTADFDTSVQLRFAIPVEVSAAAPVTGRLSYLATGTRAGGVAPWSVGGSTTMRVAAGVEGGAGEETTLARGGSVSVPFVASTTTRVSAVDGAVEVDAPAGTQFSDGQATVTGWYEHDGVRHTDGMTLTDGERLDGGSRYRWHWTTQPSWSVPPGTRFGWAVTVDTPADAVAKRGALTADLHGDALQGPFDTRATTATTIPENDEVLVGVDGPATSLVRGDTSTVEARLRSTVETTSPRDGSVVRFDAPAGTTFDSGAAIRGEYQLPGSDQTRQFTADQLVDGERTEDDTVLTYRWADTGWQLPAGTVIRFAVPVTVPSDAPAGTEALTTVATGRTDQGTFAASATTATTIAAAPTLTPVSLRNERLVAGWDNILRGSGHPGAGLEVDDHFGNRLAAAVVHADGSWQAVLPVPVNAAELELHFVQTSGDVTEASGAVSLPVVSPPSVTTSTTTMVPGLLNRFEGTGPGGAAYRVVNRWGTDLVSGTSTVDSDGRWRFDRVVSNGATSFEFRLQLATDGWEARTPVFVTGSTSLEPVTVLTKSVVPGTENLFEGTGSANASYRVVNDWGTELVSGTRQVDGDGRWSFRRVVDYRAHDFRFRIEQRRGAVTLLSDLFVVPAAER